MLGTQVFWGANPRAPIGGYPRACKRRPSATLTAMSKTLLIAEKPSVGQDLARVLKGPFKKGEGLPRGPRARHHLGRRAPRAAGRAGRVRPEVQALADGRPADRARAVQARRARRALAQADVGRDQTARARGRRRGRQRLRRRSRGRADLRLPVREGQRQEAGQTAVAELDDERGDEGGARARCARPRSSRAWSRPRARARRPTGSSA